MGYILDNLYWLLPLIITSVITPVLSFIVGRNKTTKDNIISRLNNHDQNIGLSLSASASILRRELKIDASNLIVQGYATMEDKTLWEADYMIYEEMMDALGLENGLIEHLREDVLSLPIKQRGEI